MAAVGLMSALNQRARDLALLRILGASRLKVARVAVQEALILSHLAFVLGVMLALGLGMIVADKLFAYGLLIQPGLSWQTLGVLYLGAWLSAVAASIVPIVRAIAGDGGNMEGALSA